MFITRAALFCSALVSAALPAFSQTYPTRPIMMIVPFAVGGPTDTIARIMGERMGKALGQQVIVENVTGAGGSIAVNKVGALRARRVHGRHRPHRHARDR